MIIRPATQNDATTMSECVTNAYQHYIERLGKPPGPMLDDYTEVIANHIVYIAELDSRVVGLVVLMENYIPILLDNLAVAPSAQGKGVGMKLLLYAEQVARDNNHTFIQLYTHELMRENIDYYLSHGYHISHNVSEKGYKRVYMRKEL